MNNNDQGASLDVRYEVEHLIYTFSSLVSSVERHKVLLLENQVLHLSNELNNPQVADLGGTLGLFLGFSFLGLFDALVNISYNAANIMRRKILFLVKK